jgi:hypothetical protein
MKKGQTSVFIIAGLIIIAAVLLILFFRGSLSIGKERVNPEIEPLYNFVKSCIEESAENAVYTIGQSGGYFYLSYSTDSGVAYYFDKGSNNMPSKQDIEKELGYYIDNMLLSCVSDFEDFSSFSINSGEIKSSAKIESGKVVFDVDYPLSIKKGESSYEISEFEDIEVPVRLNTIYEVSKEITLDQMTHEEDICITCLENWAVENDLYIKTMDYDDAVIFYITDKKIKIKNKPYVFKFANKYGK